MNKILLIEISSSKFYLMSIFLDFLKKNCEKSSKVYKVDLCDFLQYFLRKSKKILIKQNFELFISISKILFIKIPKCKFQQMNLEKISIVFVRSLIYHK